MTKADLVEEVQTGSDVKHPAMYHLAAQLIGRQDRYGFLQSPASRTSEAQPRKRYLAVMGILPGALRFLATAVPRPVIPSRRAFSLTSTETPMRG